ncbi:hypothetical protein [Spirosoma sp. KUDC1026]|uniref:hypothetical protein n=1 Tax=Spirosoma sp. KUDC1026 TaxID=2745947 RepID=UPI00159B944F|nr:hypothetical protein [Spirosoma sp. KUDC1026]QKZ12890.1 hypothetical protein HU175_09700 [Spirosoma sp. KUDC1026]
MNPYFSMTRFGRLTRTYFIENRAALLLNVGLLLIVLIICALFVYDNLPNFIVQSRLATLTLIGTFAWGTFTVQQVTLLSSKERSISYLLRPASRLEKYLLILLVSGLGFFLVYSLLFVLIDAVGLAFVKHRNWTDSQLAGIRSGRVEGLWMPDIEPIYRFQDIERFSPSTWVMAALIHPVSLVLSLLFRRFTLPFVALTIVALVAIGILGNETVQSWLFSTDSIEVNYSLPFTAVSLKKEEEFHTLELPQPIGSQLRYLVGVTVVILLYLTAYYRLKEQEV